MRRVAKSVLTVAALVVIGVSAYWFGSRRGIGAPKSTATLSAEDSYRRVVSCQDAAAQIELVYLQQALGKGFVGQSTINAIFATTPGCVPGRVVWMSDEAKAATSMVFD